MANFNSIHILKNLKHEYRSSVNEEVTSADTCVVLVVDEEGLVIEKRVNLESDPQNLL